MKSNFKLIFFFYYFGLKIIASDGQIFLHQVIFYLSILHIIKKYKNKNLKFGPKE